MRLRNAIPYVNFHLIWSISPRSWSIAYIFESSSPLISYFRACFIKSRQICIICVRIRFRKHLSFPFKFQFRLFTYWKGWRTFYIWWEIFRGTKLLKKILRSRARIFAWVFRMLAISKLYREAFLLNQGISKVVLNGIRSWARTYCI